MIDTATRDRIRRKLLHHMKEHNIGVHRLAARIEAANRRKPEIPIKTLQRFLAGSHRTNDQYVRFFEQFADSLPDADPIGELGIAMAAFHEADQSDRFVGRYRVVFKEGYPDRALSLDDLTVTVDGGFCRVTERITDPHLIVSEGVLVGQGDTAIILLQDRLTKLPTQYLLTENGNSHWMCGTQAIFNPVTQPGVRTLTADAYRRTGIRPTADASPIPDDAQPAAASVASATVGPTPMFPSPDRVIAGLIRRAIGLAEKGVALVNSLKSSQSVLSKVAVIGQTEDAVQDVPITREEMHLAFLSAAENADEVEMRRLVEASVDINEPDEKTGLTALHLCVGRSASGMVRFLVEEGAAFVPDKFGRMPSTIAAECEISDEMCDFIVEAEAAAEGV